MITFREAKISDAEFLGRCVCEGIGLEIFEKETELNSKIAENLKVTAAREDTLYSYKNAIVAEVDGNVAGALISYKGEFYHEMRKTTFSLIPGFDELDLDNMPDEAGATEFYLDTLAVLPKFRRLGVGSSLMENRISEVERKFPDLKITLLVDPENFNGLRIYTRLGFRIIDRNVIAFNHLYWKMSK